MTVYTNKQETLYSVFWLIGFVLAYLLFFPVTMRGDMFAPYYSVYFYFVATLLFVWARYFITKSIPASFAVKITILVLILALFFPISSYYYNGRMRFIQNAAEHNYPIVLNLFLDTSNQEELNLALLCAKAGENDAIIKDLKTKGAK